MLVWTMESIRVDNRLMQKYFNFLLAFFEFSYLINTKVLYIYTSLFFNSDTFKITTNSDKFILQCNISTYFWMYYC